MKFKINLQDISDAAKARWKLFGIVAYRCGWILFFAYLIASAITTGVIQLLIGFAITTDRPATFDRTNLGIRREVNYVDIRKSVLDRNLFNKEGEFPEEADPTDPDENRPTGGDFAAQACSKSNLPIDLVGTIYLGETGDSLATVQEKGYSQADVYRVGDAIVGHEQAKIYKVEQKRLIVNNGGRKECLELKDPERPSSEGGYAQLPPPTPKGAPAGGDCGNIVLKEEYVKSELGPDFQEILKKGRLIPHAQGFKLIGMNKNSLFGKICLNNGDILTQINDISMQEPDKGFTFYKVFQDERDIRISLLRNGTNPMTINVQIQ